ncbi:MAG TPA: cation-transporting P-type ATPase [Anaerolineales bacterium]|nr:cation-transporting P-type ATPase [Anaerolineales bacterium]
MTDQQSVLLAAKFGSDHLAHTKYWAKSPEELWHDQSSSSRGLSQREAEKRLDEVGPNYLILSWRRSWVSNRWLFPLLG